MLISFPCILPLLSCLSNTPLLNGITISATTTLSNYNEEKLSTNVVEAVAAQIMDALWKSAVHVMDSATSRVWETTYFEVCIWLSLHLQKQQQLQHGSSTDNDSTTATSTAGDQSKITSTPSIALLSKYITRALDAYLVPSKFRDIQNKLQWEDGCSRLLVAAGYTGKLYREGLLVQGILDPISGTLTAALARMDIMTREGMQLFASRIGCLVKDLYSHVVKDSSSSGGVRSGAEVDVLAMIHASVSSCIARLSSPPSADSDTSSSKDIDHASNLTSNQFIYSLLSHFSSAAPVSNELSQFTYANVPRLISLNVNHLPTVQSLLEIAVNTLLITDSSNLDANKALFTDLVQRLSGGGVGEGTMFYKHLLFLLKLVKYEKL